MLWGLAMANNEIRSDVSTFRTEMFDLVLLALPPCDHPEREPDLINCPRCRLHRLIHIERTGAPGPT